MQREHGVSIASYQSFDSGSGAFAKVIVRAGLEGSGSGSIDMSAQITVDKIIIFLPARYVIWVYKVSV